MLHLKVTTATLNIAYRKIYVGTVGTVTFVLNSFAVTLGNVSPTSIVSNQLLSSGLRPSITTNIPIFLNKGSARFMGCFYILTSGECGFIDCVTPATWTANSVTCGNPFVQSITYYL